MTSKRVTPVFELKGSPAQRGEAHGEQARDLIRDAVRRWHGWIGPTLQISVEEYVRELVHGAGFIDAARRYSPKLLEETAGISKGSGVSHEDILALNLMDEDWWFRPRFGKALEHCSSFGVRGGSGQPPLIAQNMDLPTWLDGLQILLDIRPSDGTPAMLAPSYPGMLGLNALNELGIGVCVNSLDQLPKSTEGMPIAFIIRTVASAVSFDEADQLLQTLPHATGQNFLVCGPSDMLDYECCSESITPCRFETRIVHTNHPLIDQAELVTRSRVADGASTNSERRLNSLTAGLDEQETVDVEAAKHLLRQPPVCRGTDGGDGFFTMHSLIMEPDTRTLHLTAGPPNEHDFVAYRVTTTG